MAGHARTLGVLTPCRVDDETKTDTGNNASQFFNIGATCAHHECFWKNDSLLSTSFLGSLILPPGASVEPQAVR